MINLCFFDCTAVTLSVGVKSLTVVQSDFLVALPPAVAVSCVAFVWRDL